MMDRLWLMAAAALLLGFCGICSGASAKDIMLLGGKVVTCADAFKYRDGPLFQSFAVLSSPTEAVRNERRKAVIEELSRHIEKLKSEWEKKTSAQKRTIFASLASFAVAEIVKRYAAALPGSADEATKLYAKVARDRSIEMQKILLDTSFGAPPSAASIAGLPFSTMAIAIPALGTAAKVYELGVVGIDAAVLFGDLYLNNREYEGTIQAIERALVKIVNNTTDLKIAQINRIKTEIDAKCASR